MKQSEKHLNFMYFMLQVLFWGAAVINYAYMTQILETKGFTEVEIGILNGRCCWLESCSKSGSEQWLLVPDIRFL